MKCWCPFQKKSEDCGIVSSNTHRNIEVILVYSVHLTWLNTFSSNNEMMSIPKGERRLWHRFFKYTQEHWSNSCIFSPFDLTECIWLNLDWMFFRFNNNKMLVFTLKNSKNQIPFSKLVLQIYKIVFDEELEFSWMCLVCFRTIYIDLQILIDHFYFWY